MSAWDSSGLVGPPGPTGPQGPIGPIGPAGASGGGRFLLQGRPDTTFVNTTAENTHFSIAIPPNTTAVGDRLTIRAFGTWVVSGTAGSIVFKWKFGSTIVVDSGGTIDPPVPNPAGIRAPMTLELSIWPQALAVADLTGHITLGQYVGSPVNIAGGGGVTAPITGIGVPWDPTVLNTISLTAIQQSLSSNSETRIVAWSVEKTLAA